MNTVLFAQARDAELAWVDGQIHTSTRQQLMSGDHQEEKAPGIGGGDFMPVLDVFPQTEVRDTHFICCGTYTLWRCLSC